MSAGMESDGRTTEDMLAEIVGGTAAEVVMAARYTNAPPGQTHIPVLDDLIRTARGSDLSTLRRGDMVEIIGPSGSGKTALTHFLALPRILPPEMTIDLPGPTSLPITIALGGRRDQITLICPSTHRHPIPILARKLTSHIEGHVLDALTNSGRARKISPALRAHVDLAVREALGRVRVVRIRPRWRYLYLALRQVLHPPELVIRDMKGKGRGMDIEEGRVDMLIIDGFADGFWPERWRSEERALERKAGGTIWTADNIGLKDILALLEGFRREMGTVVVLTLQALWPQDQLYATHLPPPYPAPFNPDREDARQWPLNVQITLKGRKPVPQQPADQLLVEALRENALNGGGDGSQVYEGVVRVPGGLGAAATAEGARFDFHIGPTGVEVWL